MMKTEFLGLRMKTPVMAAAGPWSRDGESIRRLIKAGAGAVVTESVVSDTLLDVRPRIAYDGMGAQNIRLYSDIQIEGWEREMEIAKSAGGVVIASISAHTPSELAYLATKLEKFGADAIEISVSNPMWESLEVMASNPETVFEMTKEVVSNVKLPVIVKLSQNTTNISSVAKAAKKGGASGVSAINTIRCILSVDIETGKPSLATYGGYSGGPIRPLGLASVATIAQTVDIPICGIGGINGYENALEYIMLGASAVQVGTAIMLRGPDALTEIIEDLQRWAEEKQIDSVARIKGKALRNLKSFDEIKIEPATSTASGVPCTADCTLCIHTCMYGAISKNDGNIYVDKELCTGCGLCTFVCPAKKLKLDW
ncbi:nitronate monooxygenase [Anaerovorax odorimutans]|uniref:dihydrouracil dehydrogenase (NAD(+)) n=1 Tax=Anaerovorax odorimutans TaxID=109327 RepID=A0ABT1RK54_9FIRM|nr:nitronate monooxygenase [Anaerovorax odorimutans]MCQ4635558.1 nitronate monooxygenase [Anaerovorax odorimutans]